MRKIFHLSVKCLVVLILNFSLVDKAVGAEPAVAPVCVTVFTGTTDGVPTYLVKDSQGYEVTTFRALTSSDLAATFGALVQTGACHAEPSSCVFNDVSVGLQPAYDVFGDGARFITHIALSSDDSLDARKEELYKAGLCLRPPVQ